MSPSPRPRREADAPRADVGPRLPIGPASTSPRAVWIPLGIPEELNLNARCSTRTRRKAAGELRGEISRLITPRPALPLERVTVEIVLYVCREKTALTAWARAGTYRPTDPDNAAALATKPILDALTDAGVIAGDTAEHVIASPRWWLRDVDRFDLEGIFVWLEPALEATLPFPMPEKFAPGLVSLG